MAAAAINVYSTPHLWVRGVYSARLHQLVRRVEVCVDEAGLSTLEMELSNWGPTSEEQGGFELFDGSIGLGNNLSVAFSTDSEDAERRTVFAGTITAIDGLFDDRVAPTLRVRAEDALWRLRMTRHTRHFEGQTDAEIAETVARAAGLPVQAEAPGPRHESLLVVNQTDLALLRERARAVDAALAVDERAVQLQARRPVVDAIPLARAALRGLRITADLAHQRTEVQVHGWSVSDKVGIHGHADRSALAGETGRGKSGPEILEELGIVATEHHALEGPNTEAEARGLAEAALRERARRFVVARASLDGDTRLRVGGAVDIVDVGPWFTGRYRVASLRHTWSGGRFESHIVASRPTLGGGL